MNYESVALWVAIASLVVSSASAWIAKQIADRDQREWKQRKWFDLYFKANEVYDSLDYIQSLFASEPPLIGTVEWLSERDKEWNNLVRLIRKMHAMAVVFPRNPVTDELLACSGFKTPAELTRDRLKKVLEAVNNVREKAFLDPVMLGK